jgi:hypothetical protein
MNVILTVLDLCFDDGIEFRGRTDSDRRARVFLRGRVRTRYHDLSPVFSVVPVWIITRIIVTATIFGALQGTGIIWTGEFRTVGTFEYCFGEVVLKDALFATHVIRVRIVISWRLMGLEAEAVKMEFSGDENALSTKEQ